ncbi:MAG: thymidine phosphorylase [Candidatus Brocadiae bacterium]|nr:thymidine phosphorylase [Candidatus Brocadiia bacterium]
MFPQDIIMKKRDGNVLSKEEIEYFVKGVVDGHFQDYQSAALLMAIFLKGMNAQETSYLTQAMMNSGEVLSFPAIPKAKVDKHSTGGVGDKVSLILAPLAACCGLCVPMISGRGLGHTGGTLDKLESMKGFRVDLSPKEFEKQLEHLGVAMIGQTSNIAPADKKLYALRDVTGTVESIPLICASIMSKKLAEGIDSLVLDVKYGKGAFMKSFENAKILAQNMVAIGKNMNRPTVALLTDMNQPLGKMVGNALEMIESFECLKGRGPKDLVDLTIELTAQMVVLGHVEKDIHKAKKLVQEKLASGIALEKMKEMIACQGGDPRVADDYSLLPQAKFQESFQARQKGWVYEIEALKVGVAGMILGAGRESIKDKINPAVGFTNLAKVGDEVKPGDLLCTIHYDDQHKKQEAVHLLEKAFVIRETKPPLPNLIQEVVQ